MKTLRLKIADQDFNELQRLVFADMPKEAGAFALAGSVKHADRVDILVRRPVAVPRELFRFQSEARLELAPQAINGLIALCESNGLGVVLCHSHPDASLYSPSDDYGEKRVVDTLRQFIGPDAPTASLLFYPDGVRGRVWFPHQELPVEISEVVIIGRYLKRTRAGESSSDVQTSIAEDIFDRQIRAFGKAGQALIAQTKVGIVGVGGTGSPTGEQLVRLGTQDLVLIDPDKFDPSNITRVYGAFASDLRRSWWMLRRKAPLKVELVAAHLKRINPKAKIRAIPRSVVLEDAAASLLDRDVIFLCTDEHWGRSIVNQIAYQYLIPTINLGARIKPGDDILTAGVGTVDILRPDKACLWCKQFLNAGRIYAESIPRSKRESLKREGYVEDIDTNTPSVVSVTTAVSGIAVTAYLQLLTDFMGLAGDISRLNYNIMDGTVQRGTTSILPNCICRKVRGFGNLKSLPTLTDLGFLEA